MRHYRLASPVSVLCLLLLGAGCVNMIETGYQGELEPWRHQAYDWHDGEFVIWRTADIADSVSEAWRAGYAVVGGVTFSGSAMQMAEYQIRRQGEKIRAHAALVSQKYSHTSSGSIPITTPQSSTTFSAGSATAYGPSGTTTASGSSVSTTYSTQTTWMPYSVEKYRHSVLFLVKNRMRFGAYVRDPDIETRQKYESNQGVVVVDVRPGTPAYESNVLPGDFIVSMGGKTVYGMADYFEILSRHEGKFMLVTVRRGEKVREIETRVESVEQTVPEEMLDKVDFKYGQTYPHVGPEPK